jgi:selenocysteine-specific elongation factor
MEAGNGHAPTKGVSRIGDRWFHTAALDGARAKTLELIGTYHAANPLSTGAPRQEIRSKLGADVALFDWIVADLVGARRLEASGAELRAPGRGPALSDGQQKLTEELLSVIGASGREPPSVAELEARFGAHTLSLLRLLEREQRVVQVEDNRYYAPGAVRELLGRLEGGMAGKGELAPTDLRDVLGFSRKFLIPFLEFCDKRGYTIRQGNGRVWRGTLLEKA